MSLCSVCHSDVKRNNGTQCDECHIWIHFKCAKVSEQIVSTTRSRDRMWRCAKCRAPSVAAPAPALRIQQLSSGGGSGGTSGSISKITGDAGSPYGTPQSSPEAESGPHSFMAVDVAGALAKLQLTMERVLSNQEEFRRKIDALQIGLEETKRNFAEVQRTVEFQSAQLHDIESVTKTHACEIRELKKVTPEVENLKQMVSRLMAARDDDEQSKIQHYVEIKGIPETTVDLQAAISKISTAIGCSVGPADVTEVRRVRSKKPQKEVVVKFASRELRDEFLAIARSKRPLNTRTAGLQMASEGISDGASEGSVYINEMLTPRKKALLSKAKVVAKEKNVKYVWTKNGQILMRRKSDDQNHLVIRHENDLDLFFRNN